jgi:hypothetical protein
VELVGAPAAVLADAVSFLASAGCLLGIRATEPRPASPGRRRLRRELVEGLGFVLGQPALRAITACTALTNLLWRPPGRCSCCSWSTRSGWLGQVLYNIAQISYRQALCPPGLLGRMNASIRFLVFGALPPVPLLLSPLRAVGAGRRP